MSLRTFVIDGILVSRKLLRGSRIGAGSTHIEWSDVSIRRKRLKFLHVGKNTRTNVSCIAPGTQAAEWLRPPTVCWFCYVINNRFDP